MKLQNLAVIFIIIVLPILLIVSYYLSLQIDTLNMQAMYNAKLIDSTKEAIDAFEINTTEWNANYSETADSKRRDVMASINTFTTSLANNLGVAGTSKDYMISRIPAIAFTLYDGYYIYSPAETKVAIKDDKGVAVYMNDKLCSDKNLSSDGTPVIKGHTYDSNNDGKILYEVADGKSKDGTYYNIPFTLNPENAKIGENKHILKPFTSYSEQLTKDIVINYTLDNYITIYGLMQDGDQNEDGIIDDLDKKYVSKSGYLTDISKFNGIEIGRISDTGKGINKIYFDGKKIEPEKLEEKIAYKDESGAYKTEVFNYVYECEGNTKVYYDDVKQEFFKVIKEEKIYVNELDKIYKKCTVPIKRSVGGKPTYIECYQSLKNNDTTWYQKNADGQYIPLSIANNLGLKSELIWDYSAVNYCVESYLFSKWVKDDLIPQLDSSIDWSFLQIGASNDSDPATNEDTDSAFENHKREVIKKVVESNLNQAITSYSGKNASADFYLPELTETDWDQILRNASIITFLQNVPIGTKYYNNYAIATSTVNKEYVDPNEIYLTASNEDSTYYHMPYCDKLGTNHLIGFRSIDFIQKSYGNAENGTAKYYYLHDTDSSKLRQGSKINIDVQEGCYNCIVQKSLYSKDSNTEKLNKKQKAYYTALARERYVARRTKLPAEIQAVAQILVQNTLINGDGAYIKDITAKIKIGDKEYNAISVSEKIQKNTINKTYQIEPIIEGNTIPPNDITNDLGSLDNPNGTINGTPNGYAIVTSDSKASVTIGNYDGYKLEFNVNSEGNTDWGSAYEPFKYDERINPLYLDMDAYINVKLKYKYNFETTGSERVESVWANINDYNSLTLVTTVKGVSGKVRLAFRNDTTNTTLYSQKIFELPKNVDSNIIYCKIPNNIDWYQDEWKVSIVAADNTTPIISGGTPISYYTIRDVTGLKGFSKAVNDGAKTSGRIFKLKADIPNVGTMATIAGKSGKWFNGTFEGENHTISGITIDTNVNTYNAFGLFGWVGAPATIKDLNISNINIDLNNKTQKENYRTGGLAAYCDTNGVSSISNIHVNNSTIKGTAWVGGIIGENKKYLDNCSLTNSNVYSVGKTNSDTDKGEIFVGGIAGKTENQINNAKVESSNIGNGNLNMKKESILGYTNYYYVGGITAYTTNNINGLSVTDNCNVRGGEVYYIGLINDNKKDSNSKTYTGGIVGYKKTSQEVNNGFHTNCTVSGHDNVGGMVGYNDGGDIKGLTRTGSVSGSGENVGGIVGLNNGASIKNCTNNATVGGVSGNRAENVGGIVGLNNEGRIENCNNNKSVQGDKNTGGIIGLCYGGTIELCMNNSSGTITGKENTNNIVSYETKSSNCTGTGGIAGKIYGTTVTKSGNNGVIECNYNGGGIAGLNYGSLVQYSYNSAKILSTDTGFLDKNRNRIGGICGAGNSITIISCYNTGEISGIYAGTLPTSVLYNGIGGIVGSCVDNAFFIYMGETEVIPENKYIGTIELPVVTLPTLEIGETSNYFGNCYNSGEIGGNSSIYKKTNGIVGCVLWAPGGGTVTFENNFYRNNVDKGAQDSWSSTISAGLNKKGSTELKNQLYKWATNTTDNEYLLLQGTTDTYVYNTTAPVRTELGPGRTELGYEGYGILWWQLPNNYKRTTFHIQDDVGAPIYLPTLYLSGNGVALNDKNLECNKNATGATVSEYDTYGYVLWLDANKTHTCYAKDEGNNYPAKDKYGNPVADPIYRPTQESPMKVEVGKVNHVYIGKRPEFIFAKANNNNNSLSGYQGENLIIPQGDYYVIAVGGGGSAPILTVGGLTVHNGGGSGAAYIGLVNLDGTYKYQVGYGGHTSGTDGTNGASTLLQKGNTKILAGGGIAGGTLKIDGGNILDKIANAFKNILEKGGYAGTLNENVTEIERYLSTNGKQGQSDGLFCSTGGQSVVQTGNLSSGFGLNRGKGRSRAFFCRR